MSKQGTYPDDVLEGGMPNPLCSRHIGHKLAKLKFFVLIFKHVLLKLRVTLHPSCNKKLPIQADPSGTSH